MSSAHYAGDAANGARFAWIGGMTNDPVKGAGTADVTACIFRIEGKVLAVIMGHNGYLRTDKMTNDDRRTMAKSTEWVHGYRSHTAVELVKACDEIEALERERDALVAHVERLREAGAELVDLIDGVREGVYTPDSFTNQIMAEVLAETPETSLARRDTQTAVNTLQEAARQAKKLGDTDTEEWLLIIAERRQQAEADYALTKAELRHQAKGSARPGYAGVTVWVGNRECTQVVDRVLLENSRADELQRRFENAQYLIRQAGGDE